jgi:ABC-type transport system involved in multi-copper enzyme maturation permease subunit
MGAGTVTATTTGLRPAGGIARGGFGSALRAEWVKFRTVRGWSVALVTSVVLCVVFTYLVANGNHTGTCTGRGACTSGHAFVPTGPAGEAVADSYEYHYQHLTGNGTLTARLASLTGLISTRPPDAAPSITATRSGGATWAKAGVLVTTTTKQGSSYAAVLATGSHGLRFQSDYTGDQTGAPGVVSGSSPRWLRLTRNGYTITGYDSTNGTSWHEIGSTHLAGLPATVDVGLFATSPVTYQGSLGGVPTQATATFDDVGLNAHTVTTGWQNLSIGASDYYPKLAASSSQLSHDAVVLTGSGDIAPAVNLTALGGNTASHSMLFGIVVALIVLIVVATLFITVEYRRGLIRTTFTAIPQRGSVLAAKAVVIGIVTFVIGAIAAAVAIPVGVHVLDTGGNYIFPTNALTLIQIIAGTGALLAITAVGVLALGTILRTSAGAVTAGIVLFILPNLVGPGVLGQGGTGGFTTALYRFSPAAAFSIFGVLPRSSLVSFPYTLANGYYPLSAWAGLAVLAAYTAVALMLAAYLLRRRDA